MTIITYSATIANIIVAVLSLKYYSNTPSYKWIRLYCLTKGIIDLLAVILNKLIITNIPLFFIMIWSEVFLILHFFISVSPTILKIPKVTLMLTAYVLLLCTFLYFENLFKFSVHSRIIEGIIVFACCLAYFRDEFKSLRLTILFSEPTYWFISSFLIYYGSTWLILLGSTYFIADKNLFVYVWDFQNILAILQNILIFIGFRYLK